MPKRHSTATVRRPPSSHTSALLVVPTAIPWDRLAGSELEECLYWLLDAIGAKNLSWRRGGQGDGAPDQGRDLEADFYTPDSEGRAIRRRWWIEAKGRRHDSTVERSRVQQAVFDVAAHKEVDHLLIATNTTFSNPTRDWVAEWTRIHPRPGVHLWDRTELERLLADHPHVVARFFAEALSRQGQLELSRSRFWNYATYADVPILEALWRDRKELDWDPQSLLAVVVSEAASGRIAERPWSTLMSDAGLLEVLRIGVANTGYFFLRASSVGSQDWPYYRGIAHLILAALARWPVEAVRECLLGFLDGMRGHSIPRSNCRSVLREFLKPVISQLHAELRDVCSSGCKRVSMDRVVLSEREVASYWQRLTVPKPRRGALERRRGIVTIEDGHSPCHVGFSLGPGQGCPLIALRDTALVVRQLGTTLAMFSKIVRAHQAS